MSEKIFILLFGLFPARFRAAWRDDAVDLIRSRAADERGLIRRVRLWFDLLADLVQSLPRVYASDSGPAPAPAAPPQAVPSFRLLHQEPVRSSAYFLGAIASILVLSIVAFMAKHGGRLPVIHANPFAEASGLTMDPWATDKHGALANGGSAAELIGQGPAATPGQSGSSARAATVLRLVKPPALFDSAERLRVIDGIVAKLNQHYYDPALARQIGKSLIARQNSGAYEINDPDAFAAALTRDLRSVSRDLHFEVVFSQRVLHEPAPSTAQDDAQYRHVLLEANCTFDKVEILPGNVGYLKLDSFPSPEVCGSSAIAALKTLSRADSLIIDLRDNAGGQPAMVMFLAGWLFDKPAFFYNSREDSAANMWTHSPMAGSGLASKPVYVLTSSRTVSAAEHFSYNLKMLHRATLIGETTAGATDGGIFHRIDDHFGIGLRESRVPNPYPVPDWTVTGVQPDIRVPADQALETAKRLAQQQLARR
jgi:hypothetical protein